MVICIVLAIIVFILMLLGWVASIKEEDFELFGGVSILCLIVIGFLILPFVSLDRSSGQTIGEITSVDKNFFGTTAIYIKTSETEQEKYCAENKKVIEYAKQNIGKKVKISYGTRLGLYPMNKCHKAPINKIEEVKEG